MTSQHERDLMKEAAERLAEFAVDRHGTCSICWKRDSSGNVIKGHRDHCIIVELERAAINPRRAA